MPVMFLSDLEAASYGRYGDSVPPCTDLDDT